MCYRHYGSPLLRQALRDLKSFYTPIMAITYGHYSNFVVAYHLNSTDLDKCLNCVRSKFSTPVRATALSSLFTIQSAQAANLGKCITTSRKSVCYRFGFIHDDVCAHESLVPMEEGTTGPWIGTSRAPESHLHYLSFIQHPSLRFGKLVPVVLAYIKTQQCLASYALMHNVVFESTENKYFWMERGKGPRGRNCGEIQEGGD